MWVKLKILNKNNIFQRVGRMKKKTQIGTHVACGLFHSNNMHRPPALIRRNLCINNDFHFNLQPATGLRIKNQNLFLKKKYVCNQSLIQFTALVILYLSQRFNRFIWKSFLIF